MEKSPGSGQKRTESDRDGHWTPIRTILGQGVQIREDRPETAANYGRSATKPSNRTLTTKQWHSRAYPVLWPQIPRKRTWRAIMDIADKLLELAAIDLGLPYSLVCDAWDMAEASDDSPISRNQFEYFLNLATETYEADPINYPFNAKAMIQY